MPTPILKRQIQILAKTETTAGSYEALTSAHSQGRISADSDQSYNYPVEERDIARSTLTPLGSLVGEKSFGFTVKAEVNTRDTVTADLENKALLEGCGITITEAYSVPVGTISGTFTRGETIEDESEATGRVLVAATSTAGRVLYEPISGTLASGEEVTGSSSGATADTSGPGAAAGHILNPLSNAQKTLSLGFERDGVKWQSTGVMGNLVGTFESSKKGMYEFTVQGPRHDKKDEAMTSGITYDTEQPPTLQGAALTVNGVAVVARSISFDLQNTVVLRPDMNKATTGLISAYISGRNPQLKISFEDILESSLDLEGLLVAGTEFAVKFQIGTANGKTVHYAFDNCQIIDISPGDNDGISTVEVTMSCNGAATDSDGDDEYEIIYA